MKASITVVAFALLSLAPFASVTVARADAERPVVRLDAKQFAGYVGRSELDTGQAMLVRHEADGLWTQVEGQPSIQVFPPSETRLFFRLLDAQLTFVNGNDGNVTQVVLYPNGDHEGRKVSSGVPKLDLRVGRNDRLGRAVGRRERMVRNEPLAPKWIPTDV